MTRERSREWVVEVDHPNGNTVEPEVVGNPTRNPQINNLPDIRIPVRKNEKWDDSIWEEQPMRVWFKGVRQNIEQLERVEQSDSETILVGRGGVELRNIVDDEYESEQSTTVAGNLISQNTSYTANVDTFQGTRDNNVQIKNIDTTSEFDDDVQAIPPNADPAVPIEAQNGNLELLQSCFVGETGLGSQQFSGSEYSGGDAGTLGGDLGDFGDSVSFTFTPQYSIESSNWTLKWRYEPFDNTGDGNTEDLPEIEITVNGTQVLQTTDRWIDSDQSLGWEIPTGFIDEGAVGTLGAGQQVTVEVTLLSDTDSTYDQIVIDLLAIHDTRFNYNFDNTTNANGYLSGPELYPDEFQVEFDTTNPARSVLGGRVEASFDDTSGNQQVALSNDDGQNYKTSNNTDTFETDFNNVGPGLKFRATLGRYGSTTGQTPTQGINGQKVQEYTLKADLSTIPFVINKAFNDSVQNALNFVANTGNFVWEFQIDNDGNKSVEFTENEQRDVTSDVPVETFSVTKDTDRQLDKVIVFGSSKNVNDEPFTADHGNAVDLENAWLLEGSEKVDDGAGTTFDRGVDYDISYNDGSITTKAGGAISDGQDIEVSYDYKIRETASNNVNDPATEKFEFPNISSGSLAELVALRLLEKLETQKKTVDVTIPADVPNFSPINSIDFDDIPVDDTAQIDEVQGTPQEIVVEAGTRESLSELQTEIQTQIRALNERV